HNKRIATIPKISDNIHAGLAELAMPYAQLSIELEQKENFTTTGNDQIKVLFAANKGSKLNLIKEVASGGELSRLALCFQSAIAGALALPTLIFDEIDSGVSGDVADKMGIILKKLSLNHQVLAITHSPQIAARGSSHFFVSKEVIGPKTYTRVKLLQATERVEAIAVMLSTNPPSSTAIEHARELMNSN
ncbi:MAG: DNA repair protein RecN, partial [Saprospiraceae bacterium]